MISGDMSRESRYVLTDVVAGQRRSDIERFLDNGVVRLDPQGDF